MSTLNAFMDLISLPLPSKGSRLFWRRNFYYFRTHLLMSTLWVVVEPLLYLLAFGYGVGSLVGTVSGQTYLEFIFPGLLVGSAVMVAYFETTLSSYARLTQTHLFQLVLTTPISAKEMAYGEVFWGATKGSFAAISMAFVGTLAGILPLTLWPALLSLSFVLCLLFSGIGLAMTTSVKSYDSFVFSQTGALIPMYLFSGIFFPLEILPEYLNKLSWLLPLTHGVFLSRSWYFQIWDISHVLSLIYIFTLTVLVTNWSVARLEKKILA